MFGYVTIDKPELKVKEFYRYKAFYCGLCRTLQEEYGLRGRKMCIRDRPCYRSLWDKTGIFITVKSNTPMQACPLGSLLAGIKSGRAGAMARCIPRLNFLYFASVCQRQ